VEETLEHAEREKGKRELGKDPVSGRTVLVQMTRFGPVAQIGTREEVGEDEKPKFANLKPGQSIETIEYDEVMELFKLPRTVGTYEGKELVVSAGRFGPYIKFDDAFVSIPRNEDPLELGKERAIELIEIKRKEDAPIASFNDKPVTKGKGRFGPYLKWEGMFINVPKRYDFENLSETEINELIEAKIEKEANRYIQRWEKEKIALENGRWGPFIRFGKKNVKLPKVDGNKLDAETLKTWTLEDVKKVIEAELPGSFKKKANKNTKKVTKKK
jgi:DNA topoisomerase-1